MNSITLAESVGKTLARSRKFNEHILLTWADGTFTLVSASPGYDGDADISDEAHGALQNIIEVIGIRQAEACGLITGEEGTKLMSARQQEADRRLDQWQREQYAKLKRKFEGGQP